MREKITVPRIISLRIKNFRALKDLELRNISPLTVFLGPNGSGKSTVFDVFSFISECFQEGGLRGAWNKRNRFKELRTRGSSSPIEIEIKYRQKPDEPLITYHLSIDEDKQNPLVSEEWLQWRRAERGRPFKFLDFKNGEGFVISDELPDEKDKKVFEKLDSRDLLAVNVLGQLERNNKVALLRRFITSWCISYLSADNMRGVPEAGPQERLSKTGDNLPNVIQYLSEQHPERLQAILKILTARIPRLERVDAELLGDGRLLLLLKDAPFETPILAKYASDGTLKMLAYLILLYDPNPPQLMGIEEPENYLHPRLLPILAEECRSATSNSQLLISTHSPYFVNGLEPSEVWILDRDEKGFTRTKRASLILGIKEFISNGAQLGELWLEGHFRFGYPVIGM